MGSEETIEPERARVMLAQREARAIDLRESEEFRASHAPSAVPAGLDEGLGEAVERAQEGGDLPLLVFSADGEDAVEAAARLRDEGHDAKAVAGGWEAWEQADLPTQPRSDEEYEGPNLAQPGVSGSSGKEEEDEDEDPDEEDEDEDEAEDPGGEENAGGGSPAG